MLKCSIISNGLPCYLSRGHKGKHSPTVKTTEVLVPTKWLHEILEENNKARGTIAILKTLVAMRDDGQ